MRVYWSSDLYHEESEDPHLTGLVQRIVERCASVGHDSYRKATIGRERIAISAAYRRQILDGVNPSDNRSSLYDEIRS